MTALTQVNMISPMTTLINKISNPRVLLAFLFDFSMACFSFWAALYLRYGTVDTTLNDSLTFNRYFFVAMLIHALCFIGGGLYRGVWRFSSMFDLIRVVRASALAVSFSLVACFFMTRLEGVPRTMFIIEFFLLVLTLGGGRFVYRYFKDYARGCGKDSANVLIVGAGMAGEQLLRDIHANPSLGLNVVGFLDDNKSKKNMYIHNKKVFGSSELIPEIATKFCVSKIFIAIPSAEGSDVSRILDFCKETQAEIKILPKLDQILSSRVELSLLRNLNIEDLLGRREVALDSSHLEKMIKNKKVLVTGAGGSIGSELCVQLAKFKPSHLMLVDYCELFMYELEMRFKREFPDIAFSPKILDIRDEAKVDGTFKQFRPNLVFHAAAYKHVPMMEYNPMEAVGTNICGTKIVAETALRYKAEKFVMISTDKAVNPTNVMGASKRVAEMVVTQLAEKSEDTQFISVRFGNVLGSNGSVIPLFKRQIEAGEDITVTHPDITRYFMSIPEAAQLVLQAASLGVGGEIFVLDMGEPVKIVELAREMIKLAGLKEGRDINISFSGLRPGEKLYEELFSDSESYELTMHGKIRKALFRSNDPSFTIQLNKLIHLETPSRYEVLRLLKRMVPEFDHEAFKTAGVVELLPRPSEDSLNSLKNNSNV